MKVIYDDCEVLSVKLMKRIDSIEDDIVIAMRTDDEILEEDGLK